MLRRNHKILFFLMAVLLLTSCTLTPHKGRRRSGRKKTETQKVRLEDYIQSLVRGYADQNKFTEQKEQAPQMKYRFGNMILGVPDNMRVYGGKVERTYGKISEVLPDGWRFLYRRDQGRFEYSLGQEEHPLIDNMDILLGQPGRNKKDSDND